MTTSSACESPSQDRMRITHAQGTTWQVSGPFTVAAPTDVVEKLAGALIAPHAIEYRALTVTNPVEFGLAQPAVKLTLTTKAGKEHTLWVGTLPVLRANEVATRDSVIPGVSFVIDNTLANAADQSRPGFSRSAVAALRGANGDRTFARGGDADARHRPRRGRLEDQQANRAIRRRP